MVIHHVQNVVSILLLLYLSIQDIKNKYISGFIVIPYMAAGLAIALFVSSPAQIVWSVIPGIVMIFGSIITKGNIGLGDGITILSLGLWIGIVKCSVAILVSISALFIFGLFFVFISLLKRKSLDFEKQVPFIPFLFLGLVVSILA